MVSKISKTQQAASKAKDDALSSVADLGNIANSKATQTPAQVNAQQAADAAKHAANKTENDAAHNHGQTAVDKATAEVQDVWKSVEVFATECGEKFADDKEYEKFAVGIVKGKEEDDMKAFSFLTFMKKHLPPDTLARLPYPKSTVEQMKGSNQLPDIIKVRNGITNKWVQSSFYRTLVLATPRGQYWSKRLLDNMSDEDKQKLGQAERENMDGRAKRALRTLTTAATKAGKLYINMGRIELMPNIQWGFRFEDDAQTRLVPTPKCIDLRNKNKLDDYDLVSIDQFCNFRFTPDVIKRGSVAGLMKSTQKSTPQAPSTPAANTKWEQKTGRELFDAMSAGLSFIQNGDIVEQSKRFVGLVEALTKNDSDRWTGYRMYLFLRRAYESNDSALAKSALAYQERLEKQLNEKPAATTTPAAQPPTTAAAS